MSRFLPLALLPIFLGATLVACDTTSTQPEPQPVVEAYLEAEKPLPFIRLSRTARADEVYEPRRSAIEGASVVVKELADDGSVKATVVYKDDPSAKGLYYPNDPRVVKPGTTYRLEVSTPDGSDITATTSVPDTIEILDVQNPKATYQSPDQPAFRIRPPRPELDRQNVYTFTTTSLLDFENTPDSTLRRSLTGFYSEVDSVEDVRVTSSGLLNEGNFTRNADGTITVDLPWIAVAFYGRNVTAINAVDDNYYDLIRSQQVQQGGSAPGEIPNVIEHIEGGTGIFGSYSRASTVVTIRRPDSARSTARTDHPPAGPLQEPGRKRIQR